MRHLDKRTVRIGLLAIIGIATWLVYPLVVEAAPATPAAPAVAAPQMLRIGIEQSDDVKQLQTTLASFGYGVVVDGWFGPQTDKAVRHFQKANGLLVDGIVGPITTAALNSAAGATQPAVRGEQTQTAPPPPAPAPQAATWTKCPQWEDAAKFFGLPDAFDAIMYRESRCRPDVTSNTGCCHGLLQVHRIHLPKPQCQAYTESDLFDPAKNLCVAGDLYARAGMNPWRL